MGLFTRKPRVGDTVRIVAGEYAGEAGRILSFEDGPDAQVLAVVLIGESTVPTLPLSAVDVQRGLWAVFRRIERERDDPSNRDRDYARIERGGRFGR